MNKKEEQSLLGNKTDYPETYTPSLLFAIARVQGRQNTGIDSENLPFQGADIWNAYELSWLNPNGVPRVGVAEIIVPADSPNIVESKSLKLYLGSFNQSCFSSMSELVCVIKSDLDAITQSAVAVDVKAPGDFDDGYSGGMPGICIDHLDIETRNYQVSPGLLCNIPGEPLTESLHSHLLRSLCPVTGQPDWGSVFIRYEGEPLDKEAFLKYIISYRSHCDFHEVCVERIFYDLMSKCRPDKLTVYARYTRRGGIDINPFRSNFETVPGNVRLFRQ
jgi:7-cyano-7-deazaguanine reductase